ncbi:HAD-IIB family hydrolase [Shimia thalassica]|uniref:HAD-IIB family hydrolase n=1 Tax=Shimia thalassica TaxID=1715693 RepID=UPI002494A565|nr:HAD-IIB family hydrolase [Shimia thalassica]
MADFCDLLVFTDLDGTLIDHDTYDYSPALPALSALKNMSAGLVLASSKSAPEISDLRQEIGVEEWPAIVENGAGLLPPFVQQSPDASQYETVRRVLESVPKDLRSLFLGFGDLSVAQVAQLTGLSHAGAARAKERSFSEPGQWSGTAEQRDTFLAALAQQGVTAQQGGRFLTLSLGTNKVDQMRHLIETYRPRHTIALGDAPNDIAMLEFADLGIVVANPAREPLAPLETENTGGIIRTVKPGPTGWNLAVLEAIDRFART